MAENMAESSGLGAGTEAVIQPSILNALPYFISLAIFPLVANAAIHGGWWIAGPFIFLWVGEGLDAVFGMEERNMDPKKTFERQLFWYKLAIWLWAVLWPVTLVFSLWQILVVGHLSIWEALLMAAALAAVAQASFIVGHEMIHRRSVLERRIGEFLLASASYPHYATEHIYIHHALACTPWDSGSAPKGLSFWRYFPREVASNLIDAWWRTTSTRCAESSTAGCSAASQFGSGTALTEATSPSNRRVVRSGMTTSTDARMPG